MSHTVANRSGGARNGGATPEAVYRDRLVRAPEGRKIKRVKELCMNARGEPEHVSVRVGIFGLRSVLVDEQRQTLTLQ